MSLARVWRETMKNSMKYVLGSHCTNSATNLPEQSWLVPGWQGQRERKAAHCTVLQSLRGGLGGKYTQGRVQRKNKGKVALWRRNWGILECHTQTSTACTCFCEQTWQEALFCPGFGIVLLSSPASQLSWMTERHWSCDQVFQVLWSATLFLVARDIR